MCSAGNLRKRAMASLMLSHSGRGNQTMKSKRGLMTLLVGVAMLAMPLTAAAKDHGRFNNPQGRNFAGAHYAAPAMANRHEFRHGGAWTPAVGGLDHHNWNGNHRGWN